ncbi:transcription initiation factor IIB [Nitrosopumilus ureiphilus]|uniref:Transcription initiation factor IIB n=1 Tax=Nitrosopumilus ureiphilus TaxID=1470067 RepID=A0A7D5M4X0_9ARCH|nr:transcription initiation factor IIB [Nitrosopumilus ureiphilus]QLH06151.1 transcription initiation factor IIB [Nitrosopumilus ureiphilus]
MVRVPKLQKIDSDKGNNSSCVCCIIISDSETGETFCQNCGVVLSDMIFQDRKDDDMFSDNVFALHGGNRSSLRLHDMGLATTVGKFNHDSTGRPIDYKMKQTMKRMRFWDARSKTKNTSEQNLRQALLEMEKLKEKLSLTDAIMERSSYLYRKAAKAQLIRGRSIKGVVGACVYIACREMDATRTIMDISHNLQENRKSIAKNYRMLFQNLQLTVSVPDPLKGIVKIANNLEISEKIKREAIRIFDTIKEQELIAGKKPDVVAATIIYMASIKTGEHLSQQKISNVSGVTAVSIRNRYREYSKYVKLI